MFEENTMTDWIEHTTDTCPVDAKTRVRVHLEGKDKEDSFVCYAEAWNWAKNAEHRIARYALYEAA
jgi:hypothetical protein